MQNSNYIDVEALALNGVADAQNELGRRYERGIGVQINDNVAAKWYAMAADQDHPDALNNLARLYAAGRGVPKDDTAALSLFRRAAEQGDEIAQFNLGNVYYEGRGVPVDKVEAIHWYQLSAMQGDTAAQVNVAVMYLRGEGVTQDYAEGMRWLTLACAYDDDNASRMLASVRRSGFEWLGPQPLGTSSAKRILYLRAFRGAEIDCSFIDILALSVSNLGRLVVIGTGDGETKLRKRWEDTSPDLSFDSILEYISSDADSWHPVAYEQVSRADCIVVHPSPTDIEYPLWQPPDKELDSITDFYQFPAENPVTGAGLLHELSYIDAFDRMRQTVLFCGESDYRRLEKLITEASLWLGDVALLSGGSLRPASVKIEALNKKLGALAKARSVVTFQQIELMSSAPWLCLRMEAAILQILAEGPGHTQSEEEAKAQLGVSKTARRLPPDMELKTIEFTRVEDLVFIPYGEIEEVDPKEINKMLGGEAFDRGCPYCYAQMDLIFFYKDKGDTIRGKCQRCGRRSTVVGDMLLDT